MSRHSFGLCALLVLVALAFASVPAAASHGDVSVVPSDVWIKEPGIRLERGPEEPIGTVSIHTPYVFRLPDGTLRMYYDAFPTGDVRSATSSDGLGWTKESGNRLSGGGHAHVLTLPDGRFRMYFEDITGGSLQGVGSAVSSDGLTWAREGLRLTGSYADPIVLEIPTGYRMYFRSGLNLFSATSVDGLAWAFESGVRVSDAREFAIVRLPDSSLIMYYGQASPAFASVLSARTLDGLAWTKDAGPRLLPGPPGSLDAGGVLTISILEFPGGVVRMYYQGSPGVEINLEARVFSAVAERGATKPCPLSHGFWKNHPTAWPVSSLLMGAETYTQEELSSLLRAPSRGDASLILARQLIAARLNLAKRSDPAVIAGALVDADAFLSGFAGKLPYGIRPSAPEGRTATALAGTLDAYNNGLLTPDCAPSELDPAQKPRLPEMPIPLRQRMPARPTIY